MTPAELAALQAYNDQQRQERKDAALKGYGLGFAAGAVGLGAAGLAVLSPAQRAKVKQGLLGRLDQAKKAVQEFRADRPAGVNQGNIPNTPENFQKVRRAASSPAPAAQTVVQQDPGVVERATRDVAQAANKEAADQFLARGQEPAGATGGLAKLSPTPSEFLDEAIQEVSVRELGSPQPQVPGGPLGQGILTSYPTFSQRKAAYDAAAAKPASELKRVFKPKGDSGVPLITDPNTGEVFRRGKSPESFAETYISLRPELTGQRTDLPQGRTPGTFAEFSQKAAAVQAESNTAQAAAQGDFGPQQYLKAKQYIEADTMVDQQDARLSLQVDQSVAATNSAEDQATGRVMHRIQSDHDTDLGAVNAAKEQVEAALEETISKNPELASLTPVDAAANTVADSLPGGVPIDQAEQFSIESFNKQYPEELNPQLKVVDNARQLAALRQQQAATTGEDISSLLAGAVDPVETTMRGRALRGGKPSASGDVVYQGAAGEFASADTGLKARQAQGPQFRERAELLNQLRSASDEELDFQVKRGQSALANNENISRLDADTFRLASEVLRDRALNNPEPTALQLQALERARASVDASQQALQAARGRKPTLAPGPQQDVARSMETLRRGMAVDPSEPLPQLPSVQTLRTGSVEQELGPVVGASSVYTGAAAEAAGPVIFTGKSKANTVLTSPPVTGSIDTPTGRYLTQSNPDVLGTTYNVAGTPANRAISAQIEQQAQDFLSDAIAGGLTQKGQSAAETYVTPRAPYGPAAPSVQGPRTAPLGLTGPEASQRTGYAQYQPGRSAPAPLSPFIGEMSGGTVDALAATQTPGAPRRDVGTPPKYLDLTRKGAAARYFPREELQPFVTGMEPAPIGPLTQSPGLSRIGGFTERVVQGAGGVPGAGGLPVVQQTPQGQRIAYPRMDKPVSAPGFGTSVVTNVPKYGIDPGAEDWRKDLMRSEFLRGGPIRTYRL